MAADTTDSAPTNVTDKQLQYQLEENFFHNHPASLKKTVEFVADRISSNHIKVYRAQDLPAVLAEVPQYVTHLAKDIVQSQEEDESPTINQKELLHTIDKYALQLAKKGKGICLATAPSYCSAKCQSILQLILPEETSPQVWGVAALISYRQSLDKVNNWLTMHITSQMFRKELTSELEKQVKALKKKLDAELAKEPAADLSTGNTGVLNTSGPTSNNQPVIAPSSQHKSLFFESPVRALQNATLKPKPIIEESPIRFVLSPATMTKISPSPGGTISRSTVKNLRSFDVVPSESVLGARFLSSKLSKLAQETKSVGREIKSDPAVSNAGRSTVNLTMSSMGKLNDSLNSLSMKGTISSEDNGNNNLGHKDTSAKKGGTNKKITTVQKNTTCASNSVINSEIENNQVLTSVTPNSNKENSAYSDQTGKGMTVDSRTEPDPTLSSKNLNVSFYEPCGTDTETHAKKNPSPQKNKMPKSCLVNNSGSPEKKSTLHIEDKGLCDDFVSPSEPLVALKQCLRSVIKQEAESKSYVCDTIGGIKHAIQHGPKEVTVLVVKVVGKLSVDLAFMLALKQPSWLSSDLTVSLVQLWLLNDLRPYVEFDSAVLCARHLHMLSTEKDNFKVKCKTYVSLLMTLFSQQFLKMAVLVTNAQKALDNQHLKPNVATIVSQIICDILIHLPDYILTTAPITPLESLLNTLHTRDKDQNRTHILEEQLLRVSSRKSDLAENTDYQAIVATQSSDSEVKSKTIALGDCSVHSGHLSTKALRENVNEVNVLVKGNYSVCDVMLDGKKGQENNTCLTLR